MQEIANRVYIETQYPGVCLGAVSRKHGLVLIDAPFRQEDGRTWRSTLLNLGGGVARLLIQLDAHIDRTMGAKTMECTIVSHLDAAQAFQNRPASIKAQTTDTGADWEGYNGLGSIRWGTPHITFTDQLNVHWDETPILLYNKPGIAEGSIFVEFPEEKIIFLGDAVVANQPPFLAEADLPLWIDQLNGLTKKKYQDYFFVSGRSGLVTIDDIHNQVKLLTLINNQLRSLAGEKTALEEINQMVPELMKKFEKPEKSRIDQYSKRLKYSLQQYFSRHFQQKSA